jgi:hypothetical protein
VQFQQRQRSEAKDERRKDLKKRRDEHKSKLANNAYKVHDIDINVWNAPVFGEVIGYLRQWQG